MRKFTDILKIIIGAVGWVWFFIPIIFSGIFNIGNVAGLLFFGVLLLWGVFGGLLRHKAEKRRWAKAVSVILICGYSACTVLFSVESAFMLNAVMNTPTEKTTVVVLGCAVYGETPSQMMQMRLDVAEKFLRENPEVNAVLSGGQGPDEDISEALCMYRELTKRGIDGKRLYMEEKSTSTRENIAFSAELIKEEGLCENITIVSNNYHLYRATISARQEGLSCSCISAYTPLPILPTYIMREYMGILAQWVV